MPTGYTEAIKNGITFEEFALICARAFGATITMRDEPLSADIPEFRPSNYHSQEAARYREWLAEMQAMTDEQADAAALAEYNTECQRRSEAIARGEDLKAKYEEMLRQVEAWEPPTLDHVSLKNFMRQQIEDSIKFDCCNNYPPPEQETGAAWRARKIKNFQWHLQYHEQQHAEEVERVAQRNAWVRELRKSLSTRN